MVPSTPAIANTGASTSVPQPLDQKAPSTPAAVPVPVPVIQPPQPLIKIEDEPLKSSSSSLGTGASGSTLADMQAATTGDQQGYPKGEATVKEPS
ncbi:hypothetical protein BG003_004377, partial [Podila horticola]